MITTAIFVKDLVSHPRRSWTSGAPPHDVESYNRKGEVDRITGTRGPVFMCLQILECYLSRGYNYWGPNPGYNIKNVS